MTKKSFRGKFVWHVCSFAIAVMDRIGGSVGGGRIEDGSQIEGRLAACRWIFTKAGIYNGQNYMDGCRTCFFLKEFEAEKMS